MAHGQVHILIATDDSNHLHPGISLHLQDGLLGVSVASHLVQDHALEIDIRIIVHISLDQGGAASGNAPGINHEYHRRLKKFGHLSRAAQVAVVALKQAAHALNHRDVRLLRGMGIYLPDRLFLHQVAIQIAAASACDPGMVAGIDVVHGHLEGLNREPFSPQCGEQAGHNGGLAAGASVSRYENSWTVCSHWYPFPASIKASNLFHGKLSQPIIGERFWYPGIGSRHYLPGQSAVYARDGRIGRALDGSYRPPLTLLD